MANRLQNVSEPIKNTADATIGISYVSTWIISLTPVLEFGILVLAIIWGHYRIKDMILSVKLKKMKIRRHEDK